MRPVGSFVFFCATKLTLCLINSPYCCWSLWWISADGTFSPTRNLITMRCSTLRGTFCSLIRVEVVEVVASLSQGRTTAAQCGLFTYKSVPVIFEPPCIIIIIIIIVLYITKISVTVLDIFTITMSNAFLLLFFYSDFKLKLTATFTFCFLLSFVSSWLCLLSPCIVLCLQLANRLLSQHVNKLGIEVNWIRQVKATENTCRRFRKNSF